MPATDAAFLAGRLDAIPPPSSYLTPNITENPAGELPERFKTPTSCLLLGVAFAAVQFWRQSQVALSSDQF